MRNTCKTKKKTERRGEEGEENRMRKEATNNAKTAENRAQETQMGKEKRVLCEGRNIKGVGDPGEQAG
jgi:hypothetical protein